MAAQRMTGARITDFSDREFLWFIHDSALSENDEGWVPTNVISDGIAKLLDVKNPNSNVGSRLASMRRIGFIEKSQKGPTRWRLTKSGHEFRTGSLKAQTTKALAALPDGALLEAMHIVADRSMRSEMTRLAVRREYTYSEAHGRRR